MEKKFEHKKIEVCNICQKNVNTSKDKWVAVIDYNKQKKMVTKFYHLTCLNDLLQGRIEVIQHKFEDRLKGFLKRVLGNQASLGLKLQEM